MRFADVTRGVDGYVLLFQGVAAELYTHEGPPLPSAGALRLLSPRRGVNHDPRLPRGTSSALHQVSIIQNRARNYPVVPRSETDFAPQKISPFCFTAAPLQTQTQTR